MQAYFCRFSSLLQPIFNHCRGATSSGHSNYDRNKGVGQVMSCKGQQSQGRRELGVDEWFNRVDFFF